MNPIFKYSLDCGVTPCRPHIETSFFPVAYKKYIIVENSSLQDTYQHIDEVASYLSGMLTKNSIKIIQLKFSEKDRDILGALKYQGLTLSQFNFLIKNSLLVISNSKYTAECSNALSTPSILITKERGIERDLPSWYHNKHAQLKKESFAEDIASRAISFLELQNPLERIEPIYCGQSYSSKILEVIPNFQASSLNIRNENINLRMDYHEDPSFLPEFLETNKINLITKKLPQISRKHPNLIQINLEVSLDTEEKEIEKAKSICDDVFFYSKNDTDIQKIRLKFINEEINLEKRIQKKDLDICDKICDNTYYKSSKIIISEGQNYTSYAAMKKNKALNNSNLEKVLDCAEFWEESEHFKLINIKK